MMADIAPFVLSILVGLAQPILDLNWKGRFEKLYAAKENSLEGAAEWIASIAAFFPSCILTLYGAALIVTSSDKSPGPVVMSAGFVLLIVSLWLYLREGHKAVPERRPIFRKFYFLQTWLVVLNVLGIAGAVFYQ